MSAVAWACSGNGASFVFGAGGWASTRPTAAKSGRTAKRRRMAGSGGEVAAHCTAHRTGTPVAPTAIARRCRAMADEPIHAFFRHPDGSWYRLWITHTEPKTPRGHIWHVHASYDKSGTTA